MRIYDYMHACYCDHTCMITYFRLWLIWMFLTETYWTVICCVLSRGHALYTDYQQLTDAERVFVFVCRGFNYLATMSRPQKCHSLIGRTWSLETHWVRQVRAALVCVRGMSMAREEIWQFDKASRCKCIHFCFHPTSSSFLDTSGKTKTHRGSNSSFVACLRTGGCMRLPGCGWPTDSMSANWNSMIQRKQRYWFHVSEATLLYEPDTLKEDLTQHITCQITPVMWNDWSTS